MPHCEGVRHESIEHCKNTRNKQQPFCGFGLYCNASGFGHYKLNTNYRHNKSNQHRRKDRPPPWQGDQKKQIPIEQGMWPAYENMQPDIIENIPYSECKDKKSNSGLQLFACYPSKRPKHNERCCLTPDFYSAYLCVKRREACHDISNSI